MRSPLTSVHGNVRSSRSALGWYDSLVREIVYLDICCFKRPFDDAAQERVRRLKRAATYQDRLRVQVRTPDGLPLSREGDQN